MGLVGLDRQLALIKDYVKNYRVYTKKAMLLYGPPGTGKTESVYQVARELGYKVVEYNSSDEWGGELIEEVGLILRVNSLVPTIILIDEVDNINLNTQGILAKYIGKSVKPVVLTANDINRVHSKLRVISSEVQYFKPRARDIVKIAKGIKTYVPDYRQARILAEYGGYGYKPSLGRVDRLVKYLRTGEYRELDKVDLVILLENMCKILNGYKLYRFIELLSIVDRVGRPDILNGFKVNVRGLDEPYFYRRLREGGEGYS